MSYAADAFLSPRLAIAERFEGLSMSALDEALAPLARQPIPVKTVPLFLGLPELKPGLPPDLHTTLASRIERLDHHGIRVSPIAVIPHGHSAGLMALEYGWRHLQQGRAEFCLVGGVDSYLAPETMEWLDAEGQLMSGQNRAGFPPGEGAGFSLLVRSSIAQRYHLQLLAQILNVVTAVEPSPIKTKTVCVGAGLSEAIARAARVLRLPQERIDRTYCDMNGERYRNEEFTFAVLRNQKLFVDANNYIHPADCWGDLGAASGPLFLGLAVASASRGYANGPRVLLWASSELGQRCAAVLHLYPAGTVSQ
jgi:3-oxoacyl-[acyl-carrier-protein] synthase I